MKEKVIKVLSETGSFLYLMSFGLFPWGLLDNYILVSTFGAGLVLWTSGIFIKVVFDKYKVGTDAFSPFTFVTLIISSVLFLIGIIYGLIA